MSSIGGYFGLELNQGMEEYHSGAINLNTGRNALEYILMVNSYNKLYIPFYTCGVILEPLLKLNIEYEFYSIDANLEPVFNYGNLKDNEGFLYTNYFGLKDDFILYLTGICNNIIIDNAQSFFSRPLEGVDTFYTARKFFGVSDGAYLYSEHRIAVELDFDDSSCRLGHLIKRIEHGVKNGYSDFLKTEEELKNEPIKQMSRLTNKILKSIDYNNVIKKRVHNFKYLMKELNSLNELKFELHDGFVPMVYPFLDANSSKLYSRLIGNEIFVAKYWPNVKEWVATDSFEYYLAENLLALPIDHRYEIEDMARIINLIKSV
jgi:hypothetical protein